MKISWSDFRSLRKSFSYAIRGVVYCIGNERNMRVHLAVAVNILLFALIYGLSRIEYILLFIVIGLVLLCEMVNTSIETLVNLGSPAYHNLARIAKDVAAGAVFVVAIIAIIVGAILFSELDRLLEAFSKIWSNPILISLFLMLLIGGFLFVFKGIKIKIPKKSTKIDKVKIYTPKNKNKF